MCDARKVLGVNLTPPYIVYKWPNGPTKALTGGEKVCLTHQTTHTAILEKRKRESSHLPKNRRQETFFPVFLTGTKKRRPNEKHLPKKGTSTNSYFYCYFPSVPSIQERLHTHTQNFRRRPKQPIDDDNDKNIPAAKMSLQQQQQKQQPRPLATAAAAAAAAPGLLTQVGMAGGAAVITVSFLGGVWLECEWMWDTSFYRSLLLSCHLWKLSVYGMTHRPTRNQSARLHGCHCLSNHHFCCLSSN